MSRLRWSLGAVLALVSLIIAASALRTYVEHRLWLGCVAVVVLVTIDLVGFGSLALARRRLVGEIDALAAVPPGGALLDERRRLLTSLHQAGVVPDLDALAEATAARELGRAYLGKYLVAVTVLVGLVGTFGGLMETLRSVAPLLADERVTTLKALAGPLAGLDVTFGASLVGILVTLALALVQGDLALAEEEALARLEERTRHVLVPSLWPKTEAADERAARELVALRGELGSFVARAAEEAGERVARVAAQEVDRMVRAVRSAVDDSVQGTAARVESGLLGMAAAVEAKIETVLRLQEERLGALQTVAERASAGAVESGALAARTIAQAAESTLAGITRSVTGLSTTQERLLHELGGSLAGLTGASRDSVTKLEAALRTLGEQQAAASAQVISVQSAEAARLGSVQAEAAARTEAALQRLVTAQAARAAELDAAQAARTAELDAQQVARIKQSDEQQATNVARVEAALQAVVAAHAAEISRIEQAHAASVQLIESALRALAVAQSEQEAARQQAQTAAVARSERALTTLVETHETRLTVTTEALCEAVRGTVGAEGLRLGEAAQALATAAGDLGAAAQALGTPLSKLSPELEALAREVALLAARSESEAPAATLDELARLGEGVERLEALLRMSQGLSAGIEKA